MTKNHLLVIGHRGARGLAPENTLASLRAALECKVDGIEIDVRVTADGVAVLNHDPALHDTKMLITKHRFTELQAHKQDLTTLEAAIKLVNRTVPLMIEVKPDTAVLPVAQVIQHFLANGWQADDFLLGSFSQATLLQLHRALPHIATVVIGRFSGVRSTWRARQLATKNISLSRPSLWWYFIRAMRRGKYRLYVYTLNDPHKAKQWQRYGLYGVITDFPNRFGR